MYAAGDVARWPNRLFDEEMRVEHWTNAAEQGAAGGFATCWPRHVVSPARPYAPVPFFWSDQYDRRIQFLGRAAADDEVLVVSGSIEERSFVVLYGRDGLLHGVLGQNLPRLVMKFRPLLSRRATWQAAVDLAAELG